MNSAGDPMQYVCPDGGCQAPEISRDGWLSMNKAHLFAMMKRTIYADDRFSLHRSRDSNVLALHLL